MGKRCLTYEDNKCLFSSRQSYKRKFSPLYTSTKELKKLKSDLLHHSETLKGEYVLVEWVESNDGPFATSPKPLPIDTSIMAKDDVERYYKSTGHQRLNWNVHIGSYWSIKRIDALLSNTHKERKRRNLADSAEIFLKHIHSTA